MPKPSLRVLSAAAFLLLSAASALAQGTATLTVRVFDPQQRVVGGVLVAIENAVTGLKRETLSSAGGEARFSNLPFQTYDLILLHDGFAVERRPVNLRSNVPVELEIQLRVADQVVQIDVTGSTETLIDPESTGTRTEINAASFEKIPNSPAARGLEGVLLSMPGFAANANGAIHPRGAHNQMTFVVDGMPISDQLTGAFANAVDPSIVESLDLYTGNIPAEFGNKVSGVAVVTTRTGLNSSRKFQGSHQVAFGQFDSLTSQTQFTGGTGRIGYFASFNAMKSNRFLDSVSLDNLHNGGNLQRAYTRLDYQATPRDILRFGMMSGRSSFQLANLRSQHANLQNQRQSLEDISVSAAWLRTLDSRSTVEVNSSFRNAFARLFPSPGDTPVTAHQARRLGTWNLNARYNRVAGRHTWRGGVDYQRFPLRENFSFAITSPDFNDEASEDFNPALLAHDLTQGGDWFRFSARNAGSLSFVFLQDTIRLGRFVVTLGLRYDAYRFLARGAQWQPRVGLAYHLKETGTVFRASYNRTYQTPPNENLLLANSREAESLAPPGIRDALGGASFVIRPERQNVYELGLQQAIGRQISLNGTFYHKNSRDLQDNDNFLDTGIIFPTSLASSRVNGAEGRVNLFPGRRFSSTLSATHARVVVTPPFTGGLFLGSGAVEALSAGPFIIDHDQRLSLHSNNVYNFTRSLWTSVSVRYDSGLVTNPSSAEDVSRDPDFNDMLPFVNLESDPPRVNPRTLIDWAGGYTRTSDTKKRWEVVAQVGNLTNRTALYNFQSIFVGTRVVSPRAASIRFRYYW